jgi:hypothetical protein
MSTPSFVLTLFIAPFWHPGKHPVSSRAAGLRVGGIFTSIAAMVLVHPGASGKLPDLLPEVLNDKADRP